MSAASKLMLRERLRVEEKARRDFRREQQRLEKELAHRPALAALGQCGDSADAEEMRTKIAEIQASIDGVLRRAANIRAGYVYVISNIGSLGDQMINVGLTRRLDPMDRVRELGDASVPFRYDVHALIFSEDAVGLETALHQALAQDRVNLVNRRREFFDAIPGQVKELIASLAGSLLTFTDDAEAPERRQSWAMRQAERA